MKSRRKFNVSVTSIPVLTILFFAVNGISAQSVISRATIGGYAEDITFISKGSLKDTIAMIDSYGIYTVPVKKNRSGPFTKLCDIKHPELNQRPNGITYIQSERLFAVNDVSQPTKLFLFDESCSFVGTRSIQYLNPSYAPQHMEGLAYIPTSSPTFPDHLIAVVWDTLSGPMRLEIMNRSGMVVSEISNPAWPPSFDNGLGDVTYFAPNRLLATVYGDNNLYTLDFSGNVVSTIPIPSGSDGIGEGIVRLDDGRIVASNYPQGLRFYDSSLNRTPEDDRNDVIGLNVNGPRGIAWNSDTQRLLVTHGAPGAEPAKVSSVPITLDSALQVIDLSSNPQARQAIYLPAEQLTGVLRPAPGPSRAILLYNPDGTLNSEISLSPTPGFNPGNPLTLGFLPASNEFLVSFNGLAGDPDQAAERRRLRRFSRAGVMNLTMDLTATGTGGIASVEPFQDSLSVDRLFVLGSAGRAIRTDLLGNSRNANGFLIGEFNVARKLGINFGGDAALITNGPLAGAFAMVVGDSNEVVIFRL